MADIMTTPEAEGSFAAKWEAFVDENNLTPDVAEKLQPVFYAGAFAIFEELSAITPSKSTDKGVHAAVMTFGALQSEVYGFFEEREVDDLTILSVKEQEPNG